MLIFGHRGSAGTHPENTMISFEEAARAGADGIELDIQLSKDGVPVVIHDEKLDRTTNGTGWVKDRTFYELKQLDAGAWFSDKFKGTRIPSLEEVLVWAQGNSLLINLELKTGIILYPQIEEKVIRLVEQYGLTGRVIISSFNHYSLVETRRIHRTIKTAILFSDGLYEPWKYAKTVEADGLHCHWPIAAYPVILDGAKQAGMPIRAYTVNDEARMREFMTNGVSAIFTDWPEKAVRIRRG
ncbi:hypothetical protein EFBL_0666 [Effusibacillus lacus]|uniref:GP-PDE domain-containing protein n=2 Tax=Effusibacillus lacus TaxID=1348429 RepID=A0A292YCF3_9BACL|nr:hypothetical protein EFBL_0666 [Effusibacillus lacus]